MIDESSIASGSQYDGLRLALGLAQAGPNSTINQAYLVHEIMRTLMYGQMPGIDEYVEHLKDVALLNELNLEHDDYYLVNVSRPPGFELRQHGLILSASQMVYPHQFMRRFYHANFVNLPRMLST